MKQFAAGFLICAALCGVSVWFLVYPSLRSSYYAVGYNDGRISARQEIVESLKRELGTDVSPEEATTVLFDVKASSVVIVERQAIKTLRVVE